MNKIITLGVLSILLFSCSSTSPVSEYSLQKKAPFKVLESSYKNWFGGQPGVKGVLVHIQIDNPKVILDTIYFRNMKSPLDKSRNNLKEIYTGHFTSKNDSKNLILHSDIKKEFGNQVPDISKKIPFDIKSDEAIVSYNIKGFTKYFKISNIAEKSTTKNKRI